MADSNQRPTRVSLGRHRGKVPISYSGDLQKIQIFGQVLCQVGGWWADDVQIFVGGGMGEAQRGGMKQRSLHQVGSLRVVETIAKDRVAGGGKVNPYLVGATSDEAAADDR